MTAHKVKLNQMLTLSSEVTCDIIFIIEGYNKVSMSKTFTFTGASYLHTHSFLNGMKKKKTLT